MTTTTSPTKLSARMSEEKIANAIRMRESPTEAEAVLARICEGVAAKGLDRFGRQVPMLGYILDVFFHGARLCVEADGGYHAGRRAEDATRDAVMARNGVATLRIKNELILESPGVARAMIEGEIRKRNRQASRGEAEAKKKRLQKQLAKIRRQLEEPRRTKERDEQRRRRAIRSPKGCLL